MSILIGTSNWINRDTLTTTTNIGDEIYKQSIDMGWDNFICHDCSNYEEGCKCIKGIFIAFTGANMSGCRYFEKGHKCKHCGKIT